MYSFVDYTWNPIHGRCSHDCSYCYMKSFPQKERDLSFKALEDDLGKDNFIFVGSSTDMFAEDVDSCSIRAVLMKCCLYDNTYLFQSKNPSRFWEFIDKFPKNSILGTTIETNRRSPSKAMSPACRVSYMEEFNSFSKMISIEPIMDFDLEILIDWIRIIKPEFVSIGADSKNHKLIEPDGIKVKQLIKELSKFTTVKIKSNLSRILGGKEELSKFTKVINKHNLGRLLK